MNNLQIEKFNNFGDQLLPTWKQLSKIDYSVIIFTLVFFIFNIVMGMFHLYDIIKVDEKIKKIKIGAIILFLNLIILFISIFFCLITFLILKSKKINWSFSYDLVNFCLITHLFGLASFFLLAVYDEDKKDLKAGISIFIISSILIIIALIYFFSKFPGYRLFLILFPLILCITLLFFLLFTNKN